MGTAARAPTRKCVPTVALGGGPECPAPGGCWPQQRQLWNKATGAWGAVSVSGHQWYTPVPLTTCKDDVMSWDVGDVVAMCMG